MFCKSCGNSLPEKASFCGKCGASLAASNAAPVAAPVAPVNPLPHSPLRKQQKSRFKSMIMLIALLTAIGAAVLWYVIGRSESPLIEKPPVVEKELPSTIAEPVDIPQPPPIADEPKTQQPILKSPPSKPEKPLAVPPASAPSKREPTQEDKEKLNDVNKALDVLL